MTNKMMKILLTAANEEAIERLRMSDNEIKVTVSGLNFAVYSKSNPKLNSVAICEGNSDDFLEVFEAYNLEGLKPDILVTPINIDPSFYNRMIEVGYTSKVELSLLSQSIETVGADVPRNPESNIEIKICESDSDFNGLFDVYRDVRPDITHEEFGQRLLWMKSKDCKVVAAYIDNEAAGFGCLSKRGEVGLFTSGIVKSGARGLGIQRALIARRLHLARVWGCAYACAPHVPLQSASESNLLRAGFKVHIIRNHWHAK